MLAGPFCSMLLDFDEPQLSGFRVLGNPIKLSNHPDGGPRRRAPRIGEHTQEILREVGAKAAE